MGLGAGPLDRARDEAHRGRWRQGKTLAEVHELLKHDKARCAKDREEFLRLMTDRQLRALKDLDGKHFDIPDEVRRVEVKIAPAARSARLTSSRACRTPHPCGTRFGARGGRLGSAAGDRITRWASA